MSTNLYGPGDKYDLQTSHVLPALIRKAHEARASGSEAIVIWGTGKPLREFLHVDDLADACVYLLANYSGEEHVNIGSGEEIAIGDLAELIAEVVGFAGAVTRDASKPDGTPRKMMDSGKLRAMGWRPRIGFREGIAGAYDDFRKRFAAD